MYRLREDEIFFVIKPGFYTAKSKSSDQIRDVTLLDGQQVQEMRDGTRKFTRRQALIMVMGVYDPLGLVSPALLHGKLLLRRLYGPGAVRGWDDDLPRSEKELWTSWFDMLLVPGEATFPRSTRPPRAVGTPCLAGFGDASMTAICVVLYVVWTDADGRHHSHVLTGRCRVAPLLGTTIPRGELQALVVLHRLISTIVDAYPYRFESISTFTDSLCSVGAMQKSCSALCPYFANRVLEILRICEQLEQFTNDLAPISHIAGSQNPADLGTRGLVQVGDLGPNSTWQTGPDFLTEEYDNWPRTLATDTLDSEIPSDECRAFFGRDEGEIAVNPLETLLAEVASVSQLGELVRSMASQALTREKPELTVRALARVLLAVVAGSREVCKRPPPVKMTEIAVLILLRSASRSASAALKDGKLRGLGAEVRNGLVWVTGRVRGEQLATLLETKALPVLLAHEPLARAVVHKAHCEDHRRGPRDAAARSRKAVWIVAVTRLAKTVIGRCFSCRYRDRKMQEQLMGQLPPERL